MAADFSITISLSSLIRDPFVRDAFERAERGQGGEPAYVVTEPRKPVLEGGEAAPLPALELVEG